MAGWVRGADALFEAVVAHAPWEHRTVRMYDRMVDEPRLTAWYGRTLDEPGVPPVVDRDGRGPRRAVRPRVRRRRRRALPRRSRQRRLARRPHRPDARRTDRRDRVVRIVAHVAHAPARAPGRDAAVPLAPGRPLRDGRRDPDHVGARGAQGRAGRRAASACSSAIRHSERRQLDARPELGRSTQRRRCVRADIELARPSRRRAPERREWRRDADPERLEIRLFRGPGLQERPERMSSLAEREPAGVLFVVQHPGRERGETGRGPHLFDVDPTPARRRRAR